MYSYNNIIKISQVTVANYYSAHDTRTDGGGKVLFLVNRRIV